jgi:hypothetical protein
MFTSIFVYGPGSGSETLELCIQIWSRQKFRILADPYPDPQHCRKQYYFVKFYIVEKMCFFIFIFFNFFFFLHYSTIHYSEQGLAVLAGLLGPGSNCCPLGREIDSAVTSGISHQLASAAAV